MSDCTHDCSTCGESCADREGGGSPFQIKPLRDGCRVGKVYGIVSGKGELYLDGKVSEVTAGDWFVITPEGRRALRAAPDSAMTYVCIQTAAGSLKGFTMTDGKLCEEKAPWMA